MGGENDDRLVVTNSVRIPQYELQETFSASGGPGGQHANKAATRVELNDSERQRVIDKLGEVVRVVADDERSQLRNRSLAAERMASKLRGALHVQRRRRATKPTRGSQRRRLQAKSERAEVKQQRRRPSSDE
jgi:ribosome-associated protein